MAEYYATFKTFVSLLANTRFVVNVRSREGKIMMIRY